MRKTILTLTVIVTTSITNLNAQVTNGLVAKYSFNNGDATDDVGDNDGVVTNATLTADRFGNPNKAYSFNGTNSFIDFGDSSEFRFANNTFSISFWLKYSDPQEGFVLGKVKSGSYDQYAFYIFDNISSGGVSKKLHYFSKNSIGNSRTISASDQSGNSYKHIVVVQDNDSSLLFVDNILTNVVYGDFSNGNLELQGGNFMIGKKPVDNIFFFNGKIDDIRIYNRVINAQEVDSLFNEANPNSTNIIENQANIASIYPNPSNGTFTIALGKNYSQATVQVVDVLGKVVLSTALNNQESTIDMGKATKGVYFVKVNTNEGTQSTTKVVVE